MGHSGSKMKKFRQSLRRLSFSRSVENLKKNDSKMRHSRSLTNLSIRKRDAIKVSEEKKNRRNTVVLNTNYIPDNETIIQTESDSHKENQNLNKTMEDNNVIDKPIDTKENSTLKLLHMKDEKLSKGINEKLKSPVKECSGVLALKTIDLRIEEMENQIEEMSHEDLFVYHSTFKDEIHNFWIKAYEIKEANDKVKPKKNETIDDVKRLLHKLNHKMFQRNNGSDSFC